MQEKEAEATDRGFQITEADQDEMGRVRVKINKNDNLINSTIICIHLKNIFFLFSGLSLLNDFKVLQ